jgi:DNA-binding XRE family transcriptional regulator
MLAVVKKPRTNKPIFTVRGNIPGWMISRLKKEYKSGLIIKEDDNNNVEDNNLVDIFESEWFTDVDSKTSPGENMKMYRENLGLSQAALGEKLGNVPRQNVSMMESGKRGISKETAKKLSRLFKVPVSRFI